MPLKPRRTERASGKGRLTASAASQARGVPGVLQTFGKLEYRGIRRGRPRQLNWRSARSDEPTR